MNVLNLLILKIFIEIIPTKYIYGEFININENDKLYYHIYFNDAEEEIKNKYEIYDENVSEYSL